MLTWISSQKQVLRCICSICSSLADSVKSMADKLHTTPLVTQLPLGVGRNFMGVVDLLTMDLLVWDKGGDGANFTNVPLIDPSPELEHKDFTKLGRLSELARDAPVSRERIEEALEARYNLAEQVCVCVCVVVGEWVGGVNLCVSLFLL